MRVAGSKRPLTTRNKAHDVTTLTAKAREIPAAMEDCQDGATLS